VIEQYKLTVSGPSIDRVALTEDEAFTRSVDGLRVTMQPSRAFRAGEALLLEFMVTDEATGILVTDLQPYLGSLAHFVIIPEDGSKYLHVHPMEAGASSGMNDEGMVGKMDEQMDAGPMPKAPAKVTVSAHTTFPDAGHLSLKHELWIVFAFSVLAMLTSCAIHYPPAVKRGEVPTPSVSPTVQPSPTASKPRAQSTK